MTHAGRSGFSKALRETFIAYAFDLGGLAAGFLLAYQLGVFRLAPWAIALYPAVLGAKGIIESLLLGRLSTALHLGTVNPRFSDNTKTFYSLIAAGIVLTLITSVAISVISLVFGTLFWGVTFADFPVILGVIVSTMTLGLTLFVVTVKVAFFSFKKGLDLDITAYPLMSAVAAVFITVCYFFTLTLFSSNIGVWAIIALGAAHLIAVTYIFPRNMHHPVFIKTIRESLAALMIVALVVNVTGTLLKGIDDRFIRAGRGVEVFLVYPALIGLVSDVGSVVGSTATTKLALGMLKPRVSSIIYHAKSILIAWFVSAVMFIVLALAAFLVQGALGGAFTLDVLSSWLTLLLVTNAVAVSLIVVLSFAVSILTFQKGLDPTNFVEPIENAFAASITTVALLAALALPSLAALV
ncbi:MAG: magnesium transporter [Candidatus Bathyarchaeota archaeon]|nr:magnesium transporter [Candidatus Bathyarchaeota archaeon]